MFVICFFELQFCLVRTNHTWLQLANSNTNRTKEKSKVLKFTFLTIILLTFSSIFKRLKKKLSVCLDLPKLPDPLKMATFSIWDYLVLVVMLIISAGIGLYYRFTGGKQKTTKVFIYLLNLIRFYNNFFSFSVNFFYRNIF